MSLRKHVVTAVALAVAVGLLAMEPATAAQITPIKILGGRTDQFNPGANADWLGWTQNSVDNPKHYDAFVRTPITGGTIYPLNTSRQAVFGGITPDTDEAIIQQFNRSTSDLHVFDLTGVTPAEENDPAGLNTDKWEAFPTISAGHILFLRESTRAESLRLYDRSGGSNITLDSARFGEATIEVGNVTDSYATWTKCITHCDVYYYVIGNGKTHKVPNPNHRFFYAGTATDLVGDLYFARSGNGCGVRVRILRWQIGSGSTPPVTVSSMPDGYDVLRTFTFNDGTHDNVYFDRLRCGGNFYSDIYEVQAADGA